jgi:hypothetical protein
LYFFVVGWLFSCGSILRMVGRGNTSNWALNLTTPKVGASRRLLGLQVN